MAKIKEIFSKIVSDIRVMVLEKVEIPDDALIEMFDALPRVTVPRKKLPKLSVDSTVTVPSVSSELSISPISTSEPDEPIPDPTPSTSIDPDVIVISDTDSETDSGPIDVCIMDPTLKVTLEDGSNILLEEVALGSGVISEEMLSNMTLYITTTPMRCSKKKVLVLEPKGSSSKHPRTDP